MFSYETFMVNDAVNRKEFWNFWITLRLRFIFNIALCHLSTFATSTRRHFPEDGIHNENIIGCRIGFLMNEECVLFTD